MNNFTFIVGTRPEIIKVVPLVKYASSRGYEYQLVFSKQHFLDSMSYAIFEEYGVYPDVVIEGDNYLERVVRLVEYVEKLRDTIIVVIGDTSTTLYSSIGYIYNTSNRVMLVHVESGLHSLNPLSTEERIRTIVENVADVRVAPSELESEILRRIGITKHVYPLGNPIFNLLEKKNITPSDGNYVLATFHRRTNVENRVALINFINALKYLTKFYEVKYVAHPTTVDFLRRFGLLEEMKTIQSLEIADPLRHEEFLKLLAKCSFVVTDSGGVQEEALYYKKVAVVLRPSTPRWVAILKGLHFLANVLDYEHVLSVLNYVVKHRSEIESRFKTFVNPYHKPTCARDIIETSVELFEVITEEKRRFDLSKMEFSKMTLEEFFDLFTFRGGVRS